MTGDRARPVVGPSDSLQQPPCLSRRIWSGCLLSQAKCPGATREPTKPTQCALPLKRQQGDYYRPGACCDADACWSIVSSRPTVTSGRERQERKIVVCAYLGGIPMLSVQDDLAPASGIVIGVSIGTAIWEVAIFVVWHFM
jgi:hypothetical protein